MSLDLCLDDTLRFVVLSLHRSEREKVNDYPSLKYLVFHFSYSSARARVLDFCVGGAAWHYYSVCRTLYLM